MIQRLRQTPLAARRRSRQEGLASGLELCGKTDASALRNRRVQLPDGSGNGRKSERRVGVAPLTRRCRASAGTHEQPGQTKKGAFSLRPWPVLSLGTLRGDHLDRRHLHRVSFILSRDSDTSDFDLMAEVRSEIRCRLRNHDFLWPFLQICELEGSCIISRRQTPGHAVLCGHTLGFGANCETNYTGSKRQ